MTRRMNNKSKAVKVVSIVLSIYMALSPVVVYADELTDAENDLSVQIEARDEAAKCVEEAVDNAVISEEQVNFENIVADVDVSDIDSRNTLEDTSVLVQDEISRIENDAIKEVTAAIVNVDMSNVDEALDTVTELIDSTVTDEAVASEIEAAADAIISVYDAQAEAALNALKVISEESEAVTLLEDGSVSVDWDKATEEVKALESMYLKAVSDKENAELAKEEAIKKQQTIDEKQKAASSKADELTSKADELTGKADELTNKADELTGKADELTSKADELTGKADELTNKADELTGKADELTNKADELTDIADELTKKADELANIADELTKKVEELNNGIISNNKEISEKVSESKLNKNDDINSLIDSIAANNGTPFKTGDQVDKKIEGSNDIYRFYVNTVSDGIAYGCLTYYDSESKTILRKNFSISASGEIDYNYVPKAEWVKNDPNCKEVIFGNSSNYVVAYVSDKDLSKYISNGKFIGSKVSDIMRDNEELNSAIDARNEAIDARDKAINDKDEAIDARDKAINDKDEAIDARDKAINAKNEAVNARDKAINDKDEAISARDEAISARDEAISARDEAINAKNEAVNARDEAINARDEAINELHEIEISVAEVEKELENATNDANDALKKYKEAVAMYKDVASLEDEVNKNEIEIAMLEYVKAEVEVLRKQQILDLVKEKNKKSNTVNNYNVDDQENVEAVVNNIASNLGVAPEVVEDMVIQTIVETENYLAANEVKNVVVADVIKDEADDEVAVEEANVKPVTENEAIEDIIEIQDKTQDVVTIEDDMVPLAAEIPDADYSVNWWLPLIIASICAAWMILVVVKKNQKEEEANV